VLFQKKRAHVTQQKVCLAIILYGPMYLFDNVGEYVQHHGIYLQDPKGCDLNVLYCNPHNLRPFDGESYPYTFDLDQVDQQTTSVPLEGLPEEHDLLEALNTSEPLHETPQPAAIKAQLGR
jgi:SWI/SNF-related matrix-associated actin-dependent regulator of chromatin subfamily A3